MVGAQVFMLSHLVHNSRAYEFLILLNMWKEITMASIKMIPEEEATGKVKKIYEEIKQI